jgi:hypothetical protein
VSINVCFKLSNTKVGVLQHKIPVTVFKHKICVAVTQTFLDCSLGLSMITFYPEFGALDTVFVSSDHETTVA